MPRDTGKGLYFDGERWPKGHVPREETLRLLLGQLDLAPLGPILPTEVVEEVVEQQYESAVNWIAGHPFWSLIEEEAHGEALLAYVIETCHYLRAAPWRMCGCLATHSERPAVLRHLVGHVLEEVGHERFFERALEELGCDRRVVARLRPSPVTVEWIVYMRSAARHGPLTAALCSGLMESTALDRSTVRKWHTMIVDLGLVPSAAAEHMASHVAIDEDLGHGENWRRVLRERDEWPTYELVVALNMVTTTAEMVARWFTHLESVDIGRLLKPLKGLVAKEAEPAPVDRYLDGRPVWPGPLLDRIVHGPDAVEARDARTEELLGLAFHGTGVHASEAGTEQALDYLRAHAARDARSPVSADELVLVARGWCAAVDGQRLWQALKVSSSVDLVRGWIVENRHYLESAPRHVGSAISACSDAAMREHLLKHLAEEKDHASILDSALETDWPGPSSPRELRPLATTHAFMGYLVDVARDNWKAYILGLGVLQFSLNPRDPRHSAFYAAVRAACPTSTTLLRAMEHHDQVDESLGHEIDTIAMLKDLAVRHVLSDADLAQAALIPQLAWSFLDGIHEHYGHGRSAIVQRIGWHASGKR